MEARYKKNFKKNFKKHKGEVIALSLMLLSSFISLIIYILFLEKLSSYGALLLSVIILFGMMVLPILTDVLDSCYFEPTAEEEESETDSESEEANL